MKSYDVEQGTDEWFALRAGLPTASEFKKIVTTKGVISKSIDDYAARLAGEMYAGKPLDRFEGNQWTDRGHELEDAARATYEFEAGTVVDTVGFITRNGAGCSPDGLIGDDGMLEIKCPASHTHIKYVLKGALPTDHMTQVFGQMLIAERKWCDFISYHPDLPMFLVRVEWEQVAGDQILAGINELILRRDRVYDELVARWGNN